MTASAEHQEAYLWKSLEFLLTSCVGEPGTWVRSLPGERNTDVNTVRTRAARSTSAAKIEAGSESYVTETPAKGLLTHGPWLTCFLTYTVLGTAFWCSEIAHMKSVIRVIFLPKDRALLVCNPESSTQ